MKAVLQHFSGRTRDKPKQNGNRRHAAPVNIAKADQDYVKEFVIHNSYDAAEAAAKNVNSKPQPLVSIESAKVPDDKVPKIDTNMRVAADFCKYYAGELDELPPSGTVATLSYAAYNERSNEPIGNIKIGVLLNEDIRDKISKAKEICNSPSTESKCKLKYALVKSHIAYQIADQIQNNVLLKNISTDDPPDEYIVDRRNDQPVYLTRASSTTAGGNKPRHRKKRTRVSKKSKKTRRRKTKRAR